MISRRILHPSRLQIFSTRFKTRYRIIYQNVNNSQISSTIISSMKTQSSLSNLIRVTIRYMSSTKSSTKKLKLRRCAQVGTLILRHFWKLILTKSTLIKREKSNRLLKNNQATYTNMFPPQTLQQSRFLLISSNNSYSINSHQIHWVSTSNSLMVFLCKVLLDFQIL